MWFGVVIRRREEAGHERDTKMKRITATAAYMGGGGEEGIA